MFRFSKSVLLWLTMLALPVQGVAAATMVFCGPMHERMMAAQVGEASGRHAMHVDHAQHPSHPESSDAKAVIEHGNGTVAHTDQQYSCSACVSCCAGTVASTDFLHVLAAMFVSGSPATAYLSSFSGFVPEGPEHPPRRILA